MASVINNTTSATLLDLTEGYLNTSDFTTGRFPGFGRVVFFAEYLFGIFQITLSYFFTDVMTYSHHEMIFEIVRSALLKLSYMYCQPQDRDMPSGRLATF